MEQVIKLTGLISEVMPVQSGVSSRTGNSWRSQDILFDYHEWSGAIFTNRILCRVIGENIDDFLVAVMNWNETGKCIKELSRMEEELTLAQTSRNRIARQMIDEREKHLELVNNIKALIRKLESYPDKDIAESLRKLILSRKAMKAITMSGLGINVKDEEL